MIQIGDKVFFVLDSFFEHWREHKQAFTRRTPSVPHPELEYKVERVHMQVYGVRDGNVLKCLTVKLRNPLTNSYTVPLSCLKLLRRTYPRIIFGIGDVVRSLRDPMFSIGFIDVDLYEEGLGIYMNNLLRVGEFGMYAFHNGLYYPCALATRDLSTGNTDMECAIPINHLRKIK